MVTKTITITREAYELLSHLKSRQESFSRFFMRLAKERSIAEKYFGVLKGDSVAAQKKLQKIRTSLAKDMERREHVLFGHQRHS